MTYDNFDVCLQVVPLSTISVICPNVIHGHQQVMQPENQKITSLIITSFNKRILIYMPQFESECILKTIKNICFKFISKCDVRFGTDQQENKG